MPEDSIWHESPLGQHTSPLPMLAHESEPAGQENDLFTDCLSILMSIPNHNLRWLLIRWPDERCGRNACRGRSALRFPLPANSALPSPSSPSAAQFQFPTHSHHAQSLSGQNFSFSSSLILRTARGRRSNRCCGRCSSPVAACFTSVPTGDVCRLTTAAPVGAIETPVPIP